MKFFFVFFLFSIPAIGNCQNKEISVSSFDKLREKSFILLKDSLIKSYDTPMVEVNTFYVIVKKVFFDKNLKKLRLIGKVCFDSKDSNCIGIPALGLFIATKGQKTPIKNWVRVSETSNDKNSPEKDGYFDLTTKIKNQHTSVFFFLPNFYLVEFKIGQLL